MTTRQIDILLLEDDPDRIAQFERALESLSPRISLAIWSDAYRMIADFPAYLPGCRVICLDHDLQQAVGHPDPGDGLLVAKYLVSLPLIRPVIVHSSNADRSQRMIGEFQLAGWPYGRVLPFGDNWIANEWIHVARQMMGIGKEDGMA